VPARVEKPAHWPGYRAKAQCVNEPLLGFGSSFGTTWPRFHEGGAFSCRALARLVKPFTFNLAKQG
jgi:hypothetical protein